MTHAQQPDETAAAPLSHEVAVPATSAAVATREVDGSLGKIRATGVCILLSIITFGIYTVVWYYQVHNEMKRHSGQGLGGGLALVLAIFVGIVMPYITSNEVGELYERAGRHKPVGVATGLWVVPGFLILIGPIVWFVKTNGALNAYWRSLGAR